MADPITFGKMELRDATPADASQVAALTAELGYQCTVDTITNRLTRVSGQSAAKVLVAVFEGQIAGWAQAQAFEVLESGFRVEIVGLVVGSNFRRRGVGRALVARIESWARTLGSSTIVVRSNVQREESHAFYPALGFMPTKTQQVYRLHLQPENKPPQHNAGSRPSSDVSPASENSSAPAPRG